MCCKLHMMQCLKYWLPSLQQKHLLYFSGQWTNVAKTSTSQSQNHCPSTLAVSRWFHHNLAINWITMASKNDTSPAFSTAQVAMASVDLLSKDDVSSYCMATTLQSRDLRSFRDSIRTSRFNSKVTGWFKNFESLHLPLLPSYHKQHSLFNDKFQSFWHCYWDFYWV